jgi:hypothetical protein
MGFGSDEPIVSFIDSPVDFFLGDRMQVLSTSTVEAVISTVFADIVFAYVPVVADTAAVGMQSVGDVGAGSIGVVDDDPSVFVTHWALISFLEIPPGAKS